MGEEKEKVVFEKPKQETNKEVSKLFKKIYKVQQKLFGIQVEKTGKNTFSNYKYSTKEDIIKAVKPALNESGLVIMFNYEKPDYVEAKNKKGESITAVRVRCNVSITDIETGRSVDVPIDGMAEDQQDKALWKAYTGIQKYFYLKEFGLQDSNLEDEPENDNPRGSDKAPVRSTSKNPTTPDKSGIKPKEDDKGMMIKKLRERIEKGGGSPIKWAEVDKFFVGTEYIKEVEELKTLADQKAISEESKDERPSPEELLEQMEAEENK